MMKNKKTSKAKIASAVMCGPLTIWSVLFIIIPFLILAFMSFMTKGPLGRIKKGVTPEINVLTTIIFAVCAVCLIAFLVINMVKEHRIKKARANALTE